jgi:hypothetical protein
MDQIVLSKLEEIVKLKNEINHQASHIRQLEKKCQELETKNRILKSESLQFQIGYRIRKAHFFSSSKDRQYRWKNKIECALFTVGNNALKDFNLKLSKVIINEIKDNDFDMDYEDQELCIFKNSEQPNEKLVQKLLYFKDKHFISDAVYRELKVNVKLSIPSLSQIVKYRNFLNNTIKTIVIDDGIFVDIPAKISKILRHFISTEQRPLSFEYLKVKLSADATQIGRFVKIINCTFTILNDYKNAMSPKGNYTLGIFYCKTNDESYETLKKYIPYVINQMKQIKSVNFNNEIFEIEYYFCADWMMMSEACGLYGPTSNFPCIWCEGNANEFYQNKSVKFRSTYEIVSNQANFSKKNHLGYKKKV